MAAILQWSPQWKEKEDGLEEGERAFRFDLDDARIGRSIKLTSQAQFQITSLTRMSSSRLVHHFSPLSSRADKGSESLGGVEFDNQS